MELTNPYTELNLDVSGYMLNAKLDPHNQEIIKNLQQKFVDEFGEAIYAIPTDALHTTLMDWVAPLVDYGENKELLFKKVFQQYDKALIDILSESEKIIIHFDTLGVSNGAIFLKGSDDGQFRDIRERFVNTIDLIPGTKQPPGIIHTTIARFTKQVGLQAIKDFAFTQPIDFPQVVDEFRLVNEKKVPMLKYELVRLYAIGR